MEQKAFIFASLWRCSLSSSKNFLFVCHYTCWKRPLKRSTAKYRTQRTIYINQQTIFNQFFCRNKKIFFSGRKKIQNYWKHKKNVSDKNEDFSFNVDLNVSYEYIHIMEHNPKMINHVSPSFIIMFCNNNNNRNDYNGDIY